MRTPSAAPGLTPRAASTGFDTGSDKRGDRSIAELHLPQHVLEVLADEGVHDLGDWRRLGRKRFRIFGIVPSVIKMMDKAAREASR